MWSMMVFISFVMAFLFMFLHAPFVHDDGVFFMFDDGVLFDVPDLFTPTWTW